LIATQDPQLVAFALTEVRKEPAYVASATPITTDEQRLGYLKLYGSVIDSTFLPAEIQREVGEVTTDLNARRTQDDIDFNAEVSSL
jgi:hypothetical protein